MTTLGYQRLLPALPPARTRSWFALVAPVAGLPLIFAVVLLGCEREPAGRPDTGGNVARGQQLISARGCGACHEIPGIRGANGTVAQSLGSFAKRSFIAGELPNVPENLVRWIMDPRALRPNTAMPSLGIDRQEARDVAAYLYTLD